MLSLLKVGNGGNRVKIRIFVGAVLFLASSVGFAVDYVCPKVVQTSSGYYVAESRPLVARDESKNEAPRGQSRSGENIAPPLIRSGIGMRVQVIIP